MEQTQMIDKHLKKCFSSLPNKERQIKTTVNYHFTYSTRLRSIKHVLIRMCSKRNTHPLLLGVQTSTANVKIYVVIPQQDRNKSTQDLAMRFFGIYPKDLSSYHRDTNSTMIIPTLFIVSSNQKQPRCLSTEEWI